MTALLVIIPAAPLAAAFIIVLLGAKRPRAAGWINLSGTAVALGAQAALWGRHFTVGGLWFASGPFDLTIGLQQDGLSQLAALTVAGIAFCVNLYSIGFMRHDRGQSRFFAEMAFFAGAMLTLVLSSSLIVLFAAWEAVGVASFLLIGFYFKQEAARRAAQKAFLVTRLGDVGMLLGWLLALSLMGTTDIAALLRAAAGGAIPAGALTLLALLFLCGAVGKSAQLPLAAWLPPAMIGPTPVSALIHSATMVAAGIYLLLRLYPLYAAAPGALAAVAWIGGAGALAAALTATIQMDLKRILAWSTVSQLGEMMLAVGLGGPLAAAFHFVTHAAFKATLFLSAGAVDHAAGTRDLAKMGGLLKKMPATALIFGAAALSLSGLPPFSGFWSEERILAAAASAHFGIGVFMVAVIFLGAAYIARALVAAFGKWPGAAGPDARDADALMMAAMIVSGLAAVVIGGALSGRFEKILAFAPGPEATAGWQAAAGIAALGGLSLGAWRVVTRGPVPVFGPFPAVLERIVHQAAHIPASAALALAAGVAWIERTLFDRPVHRLATLALAADVGWIETALFDRPVQRLADRTLALAAGFQAVEVRGFSDTLDGLARLSGSAGAGLQAAQSGKLYLYTLGLFIWVMIMGLTGLLGWLW